MPETDYSKRYFVFLHSGEHQRFLFTMCFAALNNVANHRQHT